MGPIRTIENLCRKCYSCVRNCPVKAIKITENWTEVIHARCIGCGQCVKRCSQQAKIVVNSTRETQQILSGKGPVVAVLGGSYPTFFHNIRPGQLVTGLKHLGFHEVHEGTSGVELLRVPYRQAIDAPSKHPLIATHCPIIVELIEKHYPRLIKNLMPVVSPMIAIGRFIKARKGEKTKVIYLGACIARKLEIETGPVADAIDTILTYQELNQIFKVRTIDLRHLPDTPFDGFPSHRGRLFPISGGPFHAFGIENDFLSPDYLSTDGEKNVLDMIHELAAGKISPRLVDIRFCSGGCAGRPDCNNHLTTFSKQQMIHNYYQNRPTPYATASHYLDVQALPELRRRFSSKYQRLESPNKQKIREILHSTNKFAERDELNCDACGYGTCQKHAMAVFQGLAENNMCLPYSLKRLAVEHVTRTKKFELTQRTLQQEYGNAEIIGHDAHTLEVLDLIAQVGPTPTTVLIRGESGTGKELTARAIHQKSQRSNQPLVSINCTTLTDSLLESELFGHKNGSFTGSTSDKKGLFEAANGGTLFLDEIGDITPKLQAELLRVLDNGEIKPVGSTVPLRVDVRLIAATNKNLEQGIKEGWFRGDLFYRLNVFTITMPPLRNRLESLKELIHLFLERTSRRTNKTIVGIDENAINAMRKHQWPGNIRELQNIIERAAVLTQDGFIRLENLPPVFSELLLKDLDNEPRPVENTFRNQRDKHLNRVEKGLIKHYLQETGGNVSLAARKADIPRRTFYRLLARYDIQGAEFREKISKI